jgi:hypothetical protein
LGDADARTKLSELTMQDAAREREIGTIRRAISEAQRRCDVAMTAVDRKRDAEQLQSAIHLGSALVQSAENVDRLAAELVAEVNNHAKLATALISTSCLPPFAAMNVGDPSGERLNGALRRAGVHRLYSGLPHASGHSDSLLADQDQALVDKLQPPSAISKSRPLF